MRNIGPHAKLLADIGIHTLHDLQQQGVLPTYRMLKARRPDRTSLNMLWALQGAVMDIDWRELPGPCKTALRQQLLKLTASHQTELTQPTGRANPRPHQPDKAGFSG